MEQREENFFSDDFLFEVSWEVCNKVGGIHATKAGVLESSFHERLILIGPDVWKGTGAHPEFIEDKTMFRIWREQALVEGLKVKVGRWNIPGKPIVILVDFTPLFPDRDKMLHHLWVTYGQDSLSGQWDYIEPWMFGYAAGKVIECFYKCHVNSNDKVVAHFHEWMTGAGILYLDEYVPQLARVLTAHATVLGRSMAGSGRPFYQKLELAQPPTSG